VPEFFVEFSAPITYLPDHPTLARQLLGLCVHAPTAAGAQTHAIRVTRGPADVLAVVPIEEADPDKVNAARSLFGILLPVAPSGIVISETPDA